MFSMLEIEGGFVDGKLVRILMYSRIPTHVDSKGSAVHLGATTFFRCDS